VSATRKNRPAAVEQRYASATGLGRGYEAQNPAGTTVSELGEISCGLGWMATAPQVSCTSNHGGNYFNYTGCSETPPPPNPYDHGTCVCAFPSSTPNFCATTTNGEPVSRSWACLNHQDHVSCTNVSVDDNAGLCQWVEGFANIGEQNNKNDNNLKNLLNMNNTHKNLLFVLLLIIIIFCLFKDKM
jgi:hypothetical protein